MKTTLPVRREHSALRQVVLLFTHIFRTLLLASGLLIVFSMQANAQDDWKSLTTIDGVEISYQKVNCDSGEVLLIKATNTLDQQKTVNLNYAFTSNLDKSIVGEGDLGQIELDANSEVSTQCGDDLTIKVFEHISMFNEDEFTLKITKR
jgi:hypothetical protein